MNRADWQAAHPSLCPGYSVDDGLLYPLLPRDECDHETTLCRADDTAACIDCGLPQPYPIDLYPYAGA